jgi:ribosomal protein L7/L12
VDIDLAITIAGEHLAQMNAEGTLEMSLFKDRTLERDFGWAFFYGPKDPSAPVAGNAPFIVDRKDGSIHVTGTAYPVENYLESYACVGRAYPFAVPEYAVILERKPGMLKISLTKLIRTATDSGLAEAKNCTDEVLAGKPVALNFPSADVADKFCADAQRLGAVAACETRFH